MDPKLKASVRVFKALSDPTRLRIVLLLLRRDLCVCELTFILEMSQSRVSHQLRLLRDADLVEPKREGHWLIYAVPDGVRRGLEPLLERLAGPAASGAALPDRGRLALCLRENVRKGREGRRGPSPAGPSAEPAQGRAR